MLGQLLVLGQPKIFMQLLGDESKIIVQLLGCQAKIVARWLGCEFANIMQLLGCESSISERLGRECWCHNGESA